MDSSFTALVLALVVVTFGAEVLVRGASVLALRAGVSSLFVGLTVVGIGTSTPELGASLVGTLQGSSGVAVGNVVGSNTFNICIILGMTALLHPIRVELRAVRRDVLVAVVVSWAPLAAVFFGGSLPRALGAVFLVGLLAYLALAFRAGRRAHAAQERRAAVEVSSTLALEHAPRFSNATWFNGALVLLGLACLVLGSRWFVGSAITLAASRGISDHLVGLTVVSAGTSLPELVTSVVAARRRNPDIVVGNVIGSNVFNVLGVLGACAIARPQEVPAPLLALDVPVMIVATLCVLPVLKSGGGISRLEGAALVGGYVAYVAWLLARHA